MECGPRPRVAHSACIAIDSKMASPPQPTRPTFQGRLRKRTVFNEDDRESALNCLNARVVSAAFCTYSDQKCPARRPRAVSARREGLGWRHAAARHTVTVLSRDPRGPIPVPAPRKGCEPACVPPWPRARPPSPMSDFGRAPAGKDRKPRRGPQARPHLLRRLIRLVCRPPVSPCLQFAPHLPCRRFARLCSATVAPRQLRLSPRHCLRVPPGPCRHCPRHCPRPACACPRWLPQGAALPSVPLARSGCLASSVWPPRPGTSARHTIQPSQILELRLHCWRVLCAPLPLGGLGVLHEARSERCRFGSYPSYQEHPNRCV